MQYNRGRTQNKWLWSQQSKQKPNKIKFGIFTAMFWVQYLCLHGILLFSESYAEIDSTWRTAKCRERKSFDTWYYIVICAALCVSFSSKSEVLNVFPKSILKSKARAWPINSSKEDIVLSHDSKELFVQCFVFDPNRKHVEARN